MAEKYPVEDTTTNPLTTLVFDENWVTFTVRYPVRFDRRRTTKHQLFSGILERVQASHGAVSIAAAAMELVPMKPLEVRSGPLS